MNFKNGKNIKESRNTGIPNIGNSCYMSTKKKLSYSNSLSNKNFCVETF